MCIGVITLDNRPELTTVADWNVENLVVSYESNKLEKWNIELPHLCAGIAAPGTALLYVHFCERMRAHGLPCWVSEHTCWASSPHFRKVREFGEGLPEDPRANVEHVIPC